MNQLLPIILVNQIHPKSVVDSVIMMGSLVAGFTYWAFMECIDAELDLGCKGFLKLLLVMLLWPVSIPYYALRILTVFVEKAFDKQHAVWMAEPPRHEEDAHYSYLQQQIPRGQTFGEGLAMKSQKLLRKWAIKSLCALAGVSFGICVLRASAPRKRVKPRSLSLNEVVEGVSEVLAEMYRQRLIYGKALTEAECKCMLLSKFAEIQGKP